jgi:hypothetical protein
MTTIGTSTATMSLQVVPELKSRWFPADSPVTYAERVWQIAINNNPFRCGQWQAASGHVCA